MGSWHPTSWLPAKLGELLGKSSARLKCQGHRSRRTAGAEMWVTAAQGPEDDGWSLSLPVPKSCHHPVASLGREEAAGEAGAPGRPSGTWASAWRLSCPALQMAGQEASGPLPCSPNRHWRIRNSLFPLPRGSHESEAGFPGEDPASGSLQSWRRPNALLFQTDRLFPSPPSPCPSDTSFPQNPILRVSPSRDGVPQRPGIKLGNLLGQLFHLPPTYTCILCQD